MIDPALFALYLASAGAMILSPGPDSLYVLTRSLADGRAVGVASAAGISAGVVVHTLAAVMGLAALFRASPVTFAAVTYLGAAYLAYLGVRTIRDDDLEIGADERDQSAEEPTPADGATVRSIAAGPFGEAVTVNVLNPQVAIFFLAFLPQFVDGGPVELQLTLLGATYAALTLCYLGSVAIAASGLRQLLGARSAVANGLRWGAGLVLIGIGLRLFLVGPP